MCYLRRKLNADLEDSCERAFIPGSQEAAYLQYLGYNL